MVVRPDVVRSAAGLVLAVAGLSLTACSGLKDPPSNNAPDPVRTHQAYESADPRAIDEARRSGRDGILEGEEAARLSTSSATPTRKRARDIDAAIGRVETCRPTKEQDIAAQIDLWAQSLQSGDPARVAAMYADDATLITEGRASPISDSSSKREYWRALAAERPSLQVESRRIVLTCNAAVQSGVYLLNSAQAQAPRRLNYSFSYRWDGNQWRITSQHQSSAGAATR